MAKISRRLKDNNELREKAKSGPLDPKSAFTLLKKFKGPKFDQTVEVCMHLGVDPKQADQIIRGSVSLPKGIGKSKRVVAFCGSDMVKAAMAAGAVEAGGEELVSKIEGGWMDFDVAVATPDMMRVISKLGKVLGPRGLMPSPKAGTVTKDVAAAVAEYAAGKVEYRTDSGGNIHAVLGKMSFSPEDLTENYNYFVDTIMKARPTTAKGEYVKKIAVSGTMTPGIEIKHVEAETA